MTKVNGYKIHPLAEELPPMSDQEFQELKEDIATNNLRERIVTYNGSVLDGIHRAKALEELGKPLTPDNTDEFDPLIDGNPNDSADTALVKFVISQNIKRRHLTVGQRAAVASSLLKLIGAKGKGRPKTNGEKQLTQAEVAKQVGTTPRAIQQLKAIEKVDPDLAKQVKSGEKPINLAAEEAAQIKTIEKVDPALAKQVKEGKKTPKKAVKEAVAKQVDKLHESALKRIEDVCGEEFLEELRHGGIKMQPGEVVQFSELKDETMQLLAPLLQIGEPWGKAQGYVGMEVTDQTTRRQFCNLCLINKGKFVDEQKGYRITVQKIKK